MAVVPGHGHARQFAGLRPPRAPRSCTRPTTRRSSRGSTTKIPGTAACRARSTTGASSATTSSRGGRRRPCSVRTWRSGPIGCGTVGPASAGRWTRELQAGAKRRVDAVLPVSDPKVFSLAAIEPGTGLVKTMAVNRNFRRPPLPTSPVNQGQARRGARRTGHRGPARLRRRGHARRAGRCAVHDVHPRGGAGQRPQTGPHDRHEAGLPVEVPDRPESPVACNGGYWCPANTGDPKYQSGRRTMWDALGHSVVTYFVALQEQVGVNKTVELAKRLGIVFRAEQDKMLSAPTSGGGWGAFHPRRLVDHRPGPGQRLRDPGWTAPTAIRSRSPGSPTPPAGRPPAPHPTASRCCAPRWPAPSSTPGVAPSATSPRSATRCGAGTVLTTPVRAAVGRPVSGQFGLTGNRGAFSLVIAVPRAR